MKEITAIIRINKMNETKKALIKAGISSFTASGRVLGRGKGQVHYDLLKGAAEGYEEAIEQLGNHAPRLVSKRYLVVVVNDNMLQPTIDAIISANQTGKPGDGKIFVSTIEDAVRVRTGETGSAILD
ncbi:nitrogen regulatory protein P-II [Chloroherpeton thalassium ATCC 35110]|uniref:Nitrogen regulatory protein P-II n=1 Tax=Chloroherpeton thalassium (strain ATCC 35110 / GB-78) TaxID=517418 RepID=B3QXW9_CHLT3|nr:P-II family nitrogen regulator [Chloroherpeton thalassium]ACF13497.1 nitrogen regulatory protein P-II [Chloroherpeton thalassium ATCC 35110]